MFAIREFVDVVDHKIIINLPDDYAYKEVEVVIMPKSDEIEFWNKKELQNVGKLGLHSTSFESDDEDYSKW